MEEKIIKVLSSMNDANLTMFYKKTRKKAHGFNRGMNFVMFPKCM